MTNLHRQPPYNTDAEQSVLGAVMLEPSSLDTAVEVISADDFYKEAHRRIFRAMLDLTEKGTEIDILTLRELLKSRNELERTGGAAYIATLVNAVPNAANIRYHCKIVREKAVLRNLINAATGLLSAAYAGEKDADMLTEEAGAVFFEIAERGETRGLRTAPEFVAETTDNLEKRYENRGKVIGVPSSIPELDEITGGFRPAKLVIVAGRPGMGKSALGLNIAAHAAIEHELPVALFSLEMPEYEVVERVVCAHGMLDSWRVQTGRMSQFDWDRWTLSSERVAKSPLHISDASYLTTFDIHSRCRRMKRQHGLGLVMVDHLGLIQLVRHKGQSDNSAIGAASWAMKQMAKDLNVPVMLLVQLNRKVEERPDKHPIMSDLRDSGEIEQNADQVLFLYRDEYYKKCTCPWDNPCFCGQRGKAEVQIAKNRGGRTGKVDLHFHGKFTLFTAAEKEATV